MDNLIYWTARFIYIFSAAFFFPVMFYSAVNESMLGAIILLVLAGGWGLGWVWQDIYQPHDGSQGGGQLPGG